ncbi:hypothetical protein RvY_08003 [Ramazzottius varieornatus]|uniref:WHIM2 domain-containing protein n=1 Tax=Ramazzottius varieornatus TaxID=947166 RepID=A0A1D1V728_RAMVA|nr:hypothetical protein RvY_08003 [Ramazzottius varieornatus]
MMGPLEAEPSTPTRELRKRKLPSSEVKSAPPGKVIKLSAGDSAILLKEKERLIKRRESNQKSRAKKLASAKIASSSLIPTGTKTPKFSLDKGSSKKFELKKKPKEEDAQNLISVNFIPVEEAVTNGTTPGKLTKPTFIVQMVTGNSANASTSGPTAHAVFPFNGGTSSGPTKCIFRLTPPVVTKATQDVRVTKPKSFTLNRLTPNANGEKVIFMPPITPAVHDALPDVPSPSNNGNLATTTSSSKPSISQKLKTLKPQAVVMAPNWTEIPRKTTGSTSPVVVVKQKKSRNGTAAAEVGSSVVMPGSGSSSKLIVLPSPEVIPLVTMAPTDTEWTDIVRAYEAAGLNARCSKEKEKKIIKDLENCRLTCEDQQVLWKALPSTVPLEVHGLLPAKIGDLLSIGRFIEILQYLNRNTRAKRRAMNLDFIVSAVSSSALGDTGAYLCLLYWLVWAFDERKVIGQGLKIRQELGVSIQSIETDHLLSGESLRQYLLTLCEYKAPGPLGNHFELLQKLKYVDLSELTVTERVDVFTFAHGLILRHTDFFQFCMNRLDCEHTSAVHRRKCSQEAYSQGLAKLKGVEDRLRVFEDGTKTSRNEDREKSKILEEQRNLTKDLERYRQDRKDAEEEAQELLKVMNMACHSDCLGYDRSFNRYWYFPELSDNVFVEAGWSSSMQSTVASSPEKPSPKLLGNFVLATRPGELCYLHDNGKHGRCDGKTAPPTNTDNRWSSYKPEQFQELYDCLNPLGMRESPLRFKLKALITQQSSLADRPVRPAPIIAHSVLDSLGELFEKITIDLIENQFLSKALPEGWNDKFNSNSLPEIKESMVNVVQLILPALVKFREPSLETTELLFLESWTNAVTETNNVSRLYFLCKVLDMSVLWQRGLHKENCRVCGKNKRNRMKRCVQCAYIFHNEECMAFTSSRCLTCCGLGQSSVVQEGSSAVSLPFADKRTATPSTISIDERETVQPVFISEQIAE